MTHIIELGYLSVRRTAQMMKAGALRYRRTPQPPTWRDCCYPVMLLVLVLLLSAGLSAMFMMDRKQAYVGGTFLGLFLLLLLCSVGGWPFCGYTAGGIVFLAPVVIEDPHEPPGGA
jgi:hypothetical protein